MADEKKVLIDVEIKIADAVNNLANLKAQIADLKANQKALGVVTDENRAQYEATAIEIKQLTAQYQVEQKEVLNAVKADKAKVGSMEQLKSQQNYNTSQIENRFKNDDKVNEKLDFIITKIAGLEATMTYKEDKKGIGFSYGGNSNGNSCK